MSNLRSDFLQRRRGEGGYREVFQVAWPLVLSTASWSIQLFCDRVFLSKNSTESVAAAMPAGMVSFALVSLFSGVAHYVNVFVAQYTGARQPERIGPAVWQGIFFSFAALLVGLLIRPLAGSFFRLVGHEEAVAAEETAYFRMLVLGFGFMVASAAASGFYTGRGKTLVVMYVNFIATGVNIFLNYVLIFGHWGFPRMGIAGAGIGTVASQGTSCLLFIVFLLLPRNRRLYGTWSGCRLDVDLFARMIRYGLPNGIQFTMDMASITAFSLLVGRFGAVQLAAATVTFTINALAFLPMIGMGIAVSTMVGRRLGENRPDLAEKTTYSAFEMAFGYMAFVSLLYVLIPGVFLYFFGDRKVSPENLDEVRRTAVVLLRFTAVYSLMDSACIIFSSAIKGAGDTKFVMWTMFSFSWLIMVIPTAVAVQLFDRGVVLCWSFLTLYVVVLAVVFFLRFRGGKWKEMRVIEPIPPAPPVGPLPSAPAPEGEIE